MEQADLRSWERQCTQDDMPKCRAACPLQMDVRPFLERMAHGDTPGARKVLERHLPLPGVLGRYVIVKRSSIGGKERYTDSNDRCRGKKNLW